MAASMEEMSTRKRKLQNKFSSNFEEKHKANDNDMKKEGTFLDGSLVWIAIFSFTFLLYAFCRYRISVLPEPKTQQTNSPVDEFYESNAEKHLVEFTQYGPRVVGSKENEIYAYNYILKELKSIQNKSHWKIEIDEQKVTGSFDIAFLSDFVSYYRDIKNIVALLEPEGGSEHSLLMSCHFDSSVDSPGAGDNAITCSVMLEMLRVFSVSKEKLQHNLIFLFNGAEENLLQASHGFITQHPWAKSVKAFVNVDSAGAGGWEVVFQTGPAHPWLVRAYAQASPYPTGSTFAQELFDSGHIPGETDYRIFRDFGDIPGPAHPWLVQTYAEVIPYPCGSILGQELFQSGAIPSDTDYRIFKEFGGDLPGLDIAYISNGYVYHTRNDKAKFIEPGCIQRGGENLLALLKKLASSPKLADPGLDKHGNMVFFDVVGYFMVHYPQRVGVIINCALVAAVMFKVIRKVLGMSSSGLQGMDYLSNLLLVVMFILLTWVAILIVCVLMALMTTMVGFNMSWFTHSMNMLGLFIIPGVIVMISIQEILKATVFQTKNPWQTEELYFEGNLCLWSSLVLVATLKGIGSAYFAMLFVLGPLIIRDRTLQIFKARNIRKNPIQFVLLHLTSLVIPHLLTIYILYNVFILFVPIMGRTGTEINPDIVVGALNGVSIIMLSTYLMGLCYVCSNIKRLLTVLSAITVVWVLAIFVTPLGFPYSGNTNQPTSMRLLAVHTHRRTYDRSGNQTYEDSGIWTLPFDYTRQKYLIDKIPALQESRAMDCNLGPYCGLPFLVPALPMFHPKRSLFLDGPTHNLPPVTCNLVDKKLDPTSLTKLSFEVEGPDHTMMYIRPLPGVTLETWTLSQEKPQPAHMPPDVQETTYYIYYSHGEKPTTPWSFSLYFKVPEKFTDDSIIVDLGFAGHYLHSEEKQSTEMKAFLKDVPEWATPLSWSATYDGYQF